MREVEVRRASLEQEEGNGNVATWKVIEQPMMVYWPINTPYDPWTPGMIYYDKPPTIIPEKSYEVRS